MARHCLRNFILISGTLLSLLIVVAFVVSAWWACMLQIEPVAAYIMAGNVSVLHDDPLVNLIAFDQHSHGLSRWATFARSDGSDNWAYFVRIPLYAVFAAVAVPTLLVWRFWPKPVKPGHCRCGYDLRGNTSGVCPECGQPFEAKGDAP